MGSLRVAEREPPELSPRATDAPLRDPVRAVVDALDALVVLVSPAGDTVHVNRTAQEYLGLAAEAARAGWYDAIHVDDREQAATARAVGLAAGAAWTMEARLLRHDGVHRRFRAKVTPVTDHAREITQWMLVLTETGYTNEESLKHEIAHGAVAFLAKPFAADVLRERVRGLLDD